jgi:C_GCAxxG_C_C family probable redox protein
MTCDERAQIALDYFSRGFSCAQSVFTAFHQEIGLNETEALKLSCSLGGGVGGLREICGAFTGMSMALGALKGYSDPEDRAAKERQYALIQQKAEQFRNSFGTVICRDLLLQNGITPSPVPAVRTEAYYKERPCARYVEACARYAQEALDS